MLPGVVETAEMHGTAESRGGPGRQANQTCKQTVSERGHRSEGRMEHGRVGWDMARLVVSRVPSAVAQGKLRARLPPAWTRGALRVPAQCVCVCRCV